MSSESPASVLVDSSDGTTIKVVSNINERYIGTGNVQDVKSSLLNTSTINIPVGGSFTGLAESTFGVAGIQINAYSDQHLEISLQQSFEGGNWDIIDTFDLLAGVGFGRTTQAVGEFFRVVVSNLGPVGTSIFRIKSILCPVVEALPRTLTPITGALSLSRSTRTATPDPLNFQICAEMRALSLDSDRNLATRGAVLTDELSFRDDFTNGALVTPLTGICKFNNGSLFITGTGTSFLTEVKIGQYIKCITCPNSALAIVQDVHTDSILFIEEAYTGATGSAVGVISDWKYDEDAGTSITTAGSEIILSSGTTPGSVVELQRDADYLPFTIGFRAKVSQRIANQEISLGLMDGNHTVSNKQISLIFSGLDNTKVIFQTSFSLVDVEQTTVTLLNTDITDAYQDYRLELTTISASLFINNIKMATHYNHIPGPYDLMYICMHINNTGVIGLNTDLTVDTFYFSNFNQLDVSVSTYGNPLLVREVYPSTPASTNVAAAVASTSLLLYNANRIGATIFNDSTAYLYLKLGTAASLTSFTVKMGAGDYYEVPYKYVGVIYGYWSAATGSARITEVV